MPTIAPQPKLKGLAPIQASRKQTAPGRSKIPLELNSPSRPSPRVQAALDAATKRKARKQREEKQRDVRSRREGKTSNVDSPVAALSPKVVEALRNSARAKDTGGRRKISSRRGERKRHNKREDSESPQKHSRRDQSGSPKHKGAIKLTLSVLARKRAEGPRAPALDWWLQKTLSPASSPLVNRRSPRENSTRDKDRQKRSKKARKKNKDRNSQLPSVRPTSASNQVMEGRSPLPRLNTRTSTAPSRIGSLPSIFANGRRSSRNSKEGKLSDHKLPSLS